MQYPPHRDLYDCRYCNDDDKRTRGCTQSVAQSKKIDCYCGGTVDCDLCHGSGRFAINRCPAAMARESSYLYIFRYYRHYKKTGQYPDGEPLVYQPIALTNVFDIIEIVTDNRDIAAAKRVGNE